MGQLVLVFGSSGALGAEVCSQLQQSGLHVLGLSRSNFDCNASVDQLVEFLGKVKPKAIINCAAMTGLDKCFSEKKQAVQLNGLFPARLFLASQRREVKMLQFSTDSVFPCDKDLYLYSEDDAPAPTTWYGITKLLGESLLMAKSPYFTVARLPMLYGPTNQKQLVGKLVEQVIGGREISVANDIYTTPVFTPDVASWAVNWASGVSSCPALIHLTSDQRMSLCEFILFLVDPMGLSSMVKSVPGSKFLNLEVKPRYGGLISKLGVAFSFSQSSQKYVSWLSVNTERKI